MLSEVSKKLQVVISGAELTVYMHKKITEIK